MEQQCFLRSLRGIHFFRTWQCTSLFGGGSELWCAGGWWARACVFLLAFCLGSPVAMPLRTWGRGSGSQLRWASFSRWCPRHAAARAFLAWAGGVAFWAPCPRPCFALGRGTPPRSLVLGSPAVTSLRRWGTDGGSRLRCAWPGGALAKLLPGPSLVLACGLAFWASCPRLGYSLGRGAPPH